MSTVERLRSDIDSGRTGDKVAASDPAAAPLGTDEEAAGTPLSLEAVAMARAREVVRPPQEQRDGGLLAYVMADRRHHDGHDGRRAPCHRRNMNWTTVVGSVAALCTTVSYLPQLLKCWRSGSAGDLSLKMLGTLATGVALWIVYGVLQNDLVIIAANAVSLGLLGGILFFKLRETARP